VFHAATPATIKAAATASDGRGVEHAMDVPAMDVPGFRLSNVYLLGYPEVSMPRSGKYLWPGARRPTIFGEDRRDGRSSVRAGTGRKPLLALELSAFGFFGLFWGCFAVLLADLSGSLGLSPGPLGVAPLAFSVAGDLVPERAGSAVSVVTTFGYGGFLLGPPLVGGLAEAIGLRAALGIIAVAGVAVFALSLRLREP
jgi:MFS family permease